MTTISQVQEWRGHDLSPDRLLDGRMKETGCTEKNTLVTVTSLSWSICCPHSDQDILVAVTSLHMLVILTSLS